MATVAENLPAVQPQPMTPQRERHMILKDQAKMFALSPLIPEHLRKGDYDQTVANCLIAIHMAERMGEMPLVVMQNIHIINGKAGFASQYMIARANASGVFTGRINWRIAGTGDGLEVTAFATLRETGKEVAFTAGMKMAKAEGWTSNKKYQSMPEVMLRYRSAAFLVRFYAPDVMLGHQTTEEIQDVAFAARPAEAIPLAAAIEHQAQPSSAEPAAAEAPQHDPSDEADQSGRDDADMGEAVTLASAKDEIDRAELVHDVNSRMAKLVPLLGDEDAEALRSHAMDRIGKLKGARS